jgi:putative peptidoglycan lipid II flippase
LIIKNINPKNRIVHILNKKIITDILFFIKTSTGTLIIINIILALVSFLKDVLLAYYIGTTAYADAVSLALLIPDIVGGNIIEPTICVSIIPLLTLPLIKNNKAGYNKTIFNSLLIFCSFAISIIVFSILTRKYIVSIFHVGESIINKTIISNLLLITVPALIFFTLYALGLAILNTNNKFKLAAFGPVIFNLVVFLSLFFLILTNVVKQTGITYISLSYIIGMVIMTLLLWIPIIKSKNLSIYKSFTDIKTSLYDAGTIKKILHYSLPFAVILICSQCIIFFERYLASTIEPVGGISSMNISFRLTQFPVWVFAAAISRVILPSLSKSHSLADMEGFYNTFRRAIKNIFIFNIPFIIFLFILREPIIIALFRLGAFTDDSVRLTSNILMGYSFTLLGQSLVFVCIRVFLTYKKIKVAMYIIILSMILNILLDYLFTYFIGLPGIGIGAAAASLISGLIMLMFMKKWFSDIPVKKGFELYKIAIINSPNIVLSLGFMFFYINFLVDKNKFIVLGYLSMFFILLIAFYTFLLLRFKIIKTTENIN